MRSPNPVSTRQRPLVRIELSLSTMITLVLVFAGLWVITRLLPVVLVLVAALIIVGTLSPAVQWLEARRLRRGWSIAIVFTTLLVITLLLVALTLPVFLAQVTNIIDQAPAMRARLVALLARSDLTARLAEDLRTS